MHCKVPVTATVNIKKVFKVRKLLHDDFYWDCVQGKEGQFVIKKAYKLLLGYSHKVSWSPHDK